MVISLLRKFMKREFCLILELYDDGGNVVLCGLV